MTRTLTLVFDGEVFRPVEPVDLPLGVAFRATIDALDEEELTTDRPLMKYLDLVVDMGVPDLAEQHDHYLYGTPKR